MPRDLLHHVQFLLAEAGFGPDSGLTTTRDGPAVVVSWHADPLIRPIITAHATDPDVGTAAGIPGLRTALEAALTNVFQAADLRPLPDPGGLLRVTAGFGTADAAPRKSANG
ncbi:hypothetical protein [Streptomyces roseolus]|uniref:hypothetical protein n=1 Tax=Streptomyces roseolus TaxID=67358 RepID=UPI001679D207|nr:hypothetical protein [Streptomyces roseolus]GGR18536.1 hypothetical protein GCM10010282_08390 [Streptomyces roseolus]